MHSTYMLVITNISVSEWSYEIDGRSLSVGRSKSCDIRVPSRFTHVSRRHAEVWHDRYGLWIHDLGSLLGTRINGVGIGKLKKASLADGDRIWLGGLEMDVVRESGVSGDIGVGREDSDDDPHPDQAATMVLSKLALFNELTPAELEVLLWMCRSHLDDVDIGHRLHRSPNTVRTQVGSIFNKLGLHSRGEVLDWLKQSTNPHLPELLALFPADVTEDSSTSSIPKNEG